MCEHSTQIASMTPLGRRALVNYFVKFILSLSLSWSPKHPIGESPRGTLVTVITPLPTAGNPGNRESRLKGKIHALNQGPCLP